MLPAICQREPRILLSGTLRGAADQKATVAGEVAGEDVDRATGLASQADAELF